MVSPSTNASEVLHRMEADCVVELEQMISRMGDEPTPGKLAELDELLKDCVETEVKFYR